MAIKNVSRLLFGGALLLAMGGCAAGTASTTRPSGEVAPSSTASEDAGESSSGNSDADETTRYASIEEFVKAVTAAGIDCSEYRETTGVAGSTGGADCGDSGSASGGWGLSLYSTVVKRNQVLQLNQDSLEPGTFLIGSNWLLTKYWGEAVELTAPQKSLGGLIWEYDSPIPAE